MSEPVSWVMKVSKNGQVSIPAPVRARWEAAEVTVVDLGGRIVVAPKLADPVAELRGAFRGRPSTDEIRRAERQADVVRERRRYG